MVKRNVVRNQKGFTMIEIIAVLVILSVLSAVAVPKFFDMQANAELKTLDIVVNDMKSRAAAAFASNMLKNNGKAKAAELGFASLKLPDDLTEIYKDFPGTFAKLESAVEYTMANGDVEKYTISYSAPTAVEDTGGEAAAPGTISSPNVPEE